MVQIIPTLFSTTEEEFKQRITTVQSSQNFKEGWVQLDLMDNKFVPNLSIGMDIIKKYPLNYNKEAQLMVVDPQAWLPDLFEYKVDRIIFPIEIDKDILRIIQIIKDQKIEAGLSVNPETNAGELEPYLKSLDAVLFMGVKPGLEGQKLSPTTSAKIKEVKKKFPDIKVGVDGGIKDSNVKELVEAGVDYLAIGSFLFEGSLDENLEKIWQAIAS